ncbi:AraC family transcriptional regulator [Leucothrix arctica]|uniref:HTH araC/xylS-type domain-containing protein n=1 Tax=Leucothrix arctica TaxID=1481894 RepID=A0A317CG96_9GAMM|nr:AraC family transcriptional regulator [Leucothrix arctica]PWQ97369.1 hypothetical protein DKT75_07465 [Leucothrix arctica]
MNDVNNFTASVVRLSEQPRNHSHLHHQIIFGLKGHAEFEVAGVSGFIQKGVGCIVTSNTSHSFFGNQENKILMLDITSNIGLFELEAAFTHGVLDQILNSPKYFQFDQDMQSLLKVMSHELETVHNNQQAAKAIGQCLLHSLYHRLRGDMCIEEVSKPRDRIDINRIKRYIHDNLGMKIQTADLARLCNLSESHFYQKFRESAGISPYQFVIDERIKVASKLITESNKSITEICFSLGFSSQSAFTNVFRKKVGMSPTAYRQNYLINA